MTQFFILMAVMFTVAIGPSLFLLVREARTKNRMQLAQRAGLELQFKGQARAKDADYEWFLGPKHIAVSRQIVDYNFYLDKLPNKENLLTQQYPKYDGEEFNKIVMRAEAATELAPFKSVRLVNNILYCHLEQAPTLEDIFSVREAVKIYLQTPQNIILHQLETADETRRLQLVGLLEMFPNNDGLDQKLEPLLESNGPRTLSNHVAKVMGDRSIPYLEKVIKQGGHDKTETLDILVAKQTRKAQEAIGRLLPQERSEVDALKMAKCLKTTDLPQVDAVLMAAAERFGDSEVDLCLMEYLKRVGPRKQHVPFLKEKLGGDVPRQEASEELLTRLDRGEAREALARHMVQHNGVKTNPRPIIEALRKSVGESNAKALLVLANGLKDPVDQAAAIGALALQNLRDTRPLFQLVQSSQEMVRVEAARTLGLKGTLSDVAQMLSIAETQKGATKKAIQAAVQRIQQRDGRGERGWISPAEDPSLSGALSSHSDGELSPAPEDADQGGPGTGVV